MTKLKLLYARTISLGDDPLVNNALMFHKIMCFAGSPFSIDRTGLNKFDFEYDPIPEYDSQFTKTIEDLIEDRITELISTNKKIYVMWSGGIDSTVIVCGLLKRGVSFEILLSEGSVEENKPMYETLVKTSNVKLHWIKSIYSSPAKIVKDDGIVLNGYPADQLFGRWKFAKNFEYSMLHDKWENHDIRTMYPIMGQHEQNGYDGAADLFLRHMHESIKGSPFEIRTVFDFMWWGIYNFGWQDRKQYHLQYLDTKDLNAVAFYDNNDFQKWTIVNHDLKLLKDTVSETCKWQLKDYIYDYTKDKDYLMNKVKMKPHMRELWKDWTRIITTYDTSGKINDTESLSTFLL